ncbi:MAG: hypothetical protein ACP5OG_03420 [Candidatus Nanoarchaeia archaeon]
MNKNILFIICLSVVCGGIALVLVYSINEIFGFDSSLKKGIQAGISGLFTSLMVSYIMLKPLLGSKKKQGSKSKDTDPLWFKSFN